MSSFDFESILDDAVNTVRGTSPGLRPILTVSDVDGAKFRSHPDTVMVEIVDVISEIGRIYRYGDKIVLDEGNRLKTLVENGEPTNSSGSVMANYFLVRGNEEGIPQPPTRTLLQHVFNSNLVLDALPVIKRYVKIPIYDGNFNLIPPGFDPESGVLVHGDAIEPLPFTPVEDETATIEERLPEIIREMLADFPFATPLDRVKTVGLFLIGLLAPQFTSTGRPLGLLDGNQPGIGKTLLANILGVVLDGTVPTVTEFSSSNDELSKRILATIRSSQQSVILIDNARTAAGGVINSTSLEAVAVEEILSLRILGRSDNHVQTNDFMWVLTMNDMKATEDLAQRSILINLSYEGATSTRRYRHNDLVAFVKANRMRIIAALYGMIEYWKAQGRPDGRATHRFNNMARIVGGILDACGLYGFLEDHQENVLSINSQIDDLNALFDTVADSLLASQVPATSTPFFVPSEAEPAKKWVDKVRESGIAAEDTTKAKNKISPTKVGKVFGRFVGRPFRVEVGDRSGTATFHRVLLPHNKSGYHFQVELEPPTEPNDAAGQNPAAEATGLDCPI